VDIPNRLTEFSVQSVSAGIDPMGEVSVRVESDEGTFIGRGASTDIVVAAARAYLNALNKVVAARRDREAGHSHRPAVLAGPAPGAAAPEPAVA
jgi:2-isopropylmalate synthase